MLLSSLSVGTFYGWTDRNMFPMEAFFPLKPPKGCYYYMNIRFLRPDMSGEGGVLLIKVF